ncbi:MAG: putative deacylase [Olleya marilimosa]|jgi:predicted deacylase|uniref:Succinylglutamate desuccinylase/aspartoacylase family protein n=1 Tax=Olleya marilimosa TaxID=272164 RepID=A0ABR8LSR8_9FLAO|nr:succinylglutamate desuccinylase/aspartoacylase family protein [Olleya marilimosa]MBD3862885.1 succinylglutamate desuccinylase/aspartoacylase family protein [Olleya marilimosa]MBD3890380.1 succinylglutamate desuccinylase/aspartoacylase family protein [Olleya marilimosa]|tara:strand:+ start:310548 stop:311516 length:969 start_codon:yes stop_codon:yes gene_type:complete
MYANEVLEILGEKIKPGQSAEVSFNVAKLHTRTPVDVPIIIERSKKPGPTILFTAGIHGDEINGIEIVRQLISKGINKPKIGTTICIPVLNIFGFINMARAFPDGRDLNRVFPGMKNGSLASRVAYELIHEVVPHVDFIVDFHTGGAYRFNAPQIRIEKGSEDDDVMAEIFGAPFILYSKNLNKSFRNACNKLGKPILLYEGGKSFDLDNTVTNTGVNGAKRIMNHFGMLRRQFKVTEPKKECVKITESSWMRAKHSGMFKATIKVGIEVKIGDDIGNITDPYGKFNHFVKAKYSGYIININQSPIVYQGDALFHISTEVLK